jgi:hypothetical protein
MSVDWSSRMLAFRGAGGEHPRCFAPAGLNCPAATAGVLHLPLQSTLLYDQLNPLTEPFFKK